MRAYALMVRSTTWMKPKHHNPVQHTWARPDQEVGPDGGKESGWQPLRGHQPDSKDRSIGNADLMHGDWRLFGRTTKKISWSDPDGLRPEASNERRAPGCIRACNKGVLAMPIDATRTLKARKRPVTTLPTLATIVIAATASLPDAG